MNPVVIQFEEPTWHLGWDVKYSVRNKSLAIEENVKLKIWGVFISDSIIYFDGSLIKIYNGK